MKFPFPENFTLAESDVIENLRKTMTDQQLMDLWEKTSRRPLKKSVNQIGAYLERNPR